jgi:hypothetical protein
MQPHALPLANDDERLFIVCSGGLKKLDHQFVVHHGGGVEVLNGAALLLGVSQR